MALDLKLGKLDPDPTRPALRLGSILTGVAPDHPLAVDHLSSMGGWQMLGNDQWGNCVAVTWADYRRLLTSLVGKISYPDLVQVLAVYKTQNPGFPDEDGGMVIQKLLEWLVKVGGPDGTKALAFAKVDHHNLDEVEAAISIFGALWTGIRVRQANMDQFNAGQPWGYAPSSRSLGGHSIITGGYDSDHVGGDQVFKTWGRITSFTEEFWLHEVDEAWIVVWPENIGTEQFQQAVNRDMLKASYRALTGRDLVLTDPQGPPPFWVRAKRSVVAFFRWLVGLD